MGSGGDQYSLKGRVAIITGSSTGIGREIAVHLHSLGARVVINYPNSNSKEADELASQLNNSNNNVKSTSAIAVRADISDPDAVKLLFDKAQKELGEEIHLVVNSAGVQDPKYPSLANTSVEDWDMTFSVNARGAFLVCREAAKRVKRGGGGRIIMITSSGVGALKPGYAAYSASKAAVEAMTKVVAKELKGTAITANCVAPGPVATELFFAGKSDEMIKRLEDICPLDRIGQPKDISHIVGFLSSDAGEWINGQVIRVNGGSTIF